MKVHALRVLLFMGFAALMLLFSGCADLGQMGTTSTGGMESAETEASQETVPLTGPNRIAPGSPQDSLEACLSRIPSDATPGQRLIAERTCQRDHEARQPILAVPGK